MCVGVTAIFFEACSSSPTSLSDAGRTHDAGTSPDAGQLQPDAGDVSAPGIGPTCTSRTDCAATPETPDCDPTIGRCVLFCSTDTTCAGIAATLCNPAAGYCVPTCASEADCAGLPGTTACLPNRHYCAAPQCMTAADCPRYSGCVAGYCDTCTDSSQCSSGSVCGGGECGQSCTTAATCDSGLVCESGVCVSCTTSSQCGPDLVCGNGTCGPACLQPSDCAPGLVCSFGACGPCVMDSECTANATCTNSVCHCAAGMTMCGGSCHLGPCVEALATFPGGVNSLAVDSTGLYWTGLSATEDGGFAGYVATMPVNGGTITTLAASPTPDGLAIDDVNVYWANQGTPAMGYVDGALSSVPKTGGTMRMLVGGIYAPADIAVDSAHIYWTDEQKLVGMAPIAGGSGVILSDSQNSPMHIVAESGVVYWCAEAAREIIAQTPPSSEQTITPTSCLLLSATAHGVAWTTAADNSVVDMPTNGGGTPSTLASGTGINTIAVDDTNVYWIDQHAVMSIPIGGGTPVTLAGVSGINEHLVADGASLYWYASASGGTTATLMKLTPK